MSRAYPRPSSSALWERRKAPVGRVGRLSAASTGQPGRPKSGSLPTRFTEDPRTIRALPGPEDFAVDRSASPPRILVSSRDLRGCKSKSCPVDGIYSVPLDGSPAPERPLSLTGRDNCSFHPHGISLTQELDGSKFLYVINHHDAADASPSRGCFRQAPGSPLRERPVTSVEVFRVEPSRLVFLLRLADPEVLTNGNAG